MAGFWRKLLRLRELTPVELQAEKHFKEIGARDPFLLAKHLGVTISYANLAVLVGKYLPDRQRIDIDKGADIETQEAAVYELIMHYLENKDRERSFTRNELKLSVKSRRRGLWWL